MSFCTKCGHQNRSGDTFCAGCGANLVAASPSAESSSTVTSGQVSCRRGHLNLLGTTECIQCRAKMQIGVRRQETLVAPEKNRLAGVFCLIGAGLIVVGAFMPYVVVFTIVGTINRNSFQFGQNLSMTYDGPLIILMALALLFSGLRLMRIVGTRPLRQREPLWITIFAGVVVLSTWLGTTFPSSNGVTFNRGYGGIVSLLGVLCGFIAFFVRRNNRVSTIR